MATAIGMGFDVSALLDSIKNADKALGDLMSKSNQASKSIINAFQQMSSQGVGAYVESLEKQIRLYESINATITETSGKAKKGYEEMKSGVDTVVNSLNNMIKILQQTNLYKEYKIKLVSDEELAKLKAYQTELSNLFNSEMQYSQRMQAIKEANANKTQRELEEYKKLSSEIERLQKLQSSATYELNKPTSMATYNAAKDALSEIERQLADHKARMVELERKYEAEILVINQQGSIARFEEIRKAERKDLEANEKYKKDKENNLNSLVSYYEREAEAVKRKAEAEENAQKRIQALAQQAMEAQRSFVERRVNDANKVAQSENDANQKAFQEALNIQQQALERFARNEHEKREEIKRTREVGLEAAQALDKAQARTESLNRAKNYQRTQKYGDTSSQALAAYDRLVSGKGQLSVNNMQDVLSKLEQAQNKINLKTSEGRERYNELEAAIKKVKATIDSVVNAEENVAKKRAKNADEAKKHAEEERKSLEKRLKLLKDIAAEQSKSRSSLYRLTQSSGDTTSQAEAAYNRIYGDKGIQSIKNFSDVLSKLESAQVKINQRTEEGRKKYEEFEKMIQRVKSSIQDLTTPNKANSDYYAYLSEKLVEYAQQSRKVGAQILADEKNYHNQRQAMYEKLFSLQAKYLNDVEKMSARVYNRTDGKAWNVSAEDVIKRHQEELRQRKKYIDEMTKMYARMFDEIARRESQNRSSKYGRIQATSDTSNQALAAYNRLYSDKGIKSINNMNTALQKLRDAQSKLNLNTEEGRKKYSQLGDAIKRVEKDMAKLSQQSENVNKKHSQLLDISGQLQRRLALVFSVSQITGYINKIVQVRGEFELQQKALQAIVQNTDKANELWAQTVELAVKSPFRVKELVTYTKQLAAYRVESDKLYDTTKRLADVSAGLGVDMQRLILAYGQVKAANYLRGTELRQFSEAGINMLGELSKYFSEIENRAVSVADVFDRISKRGVSFGDVEAVFQRITSAGGVFYDMQAKQAETLKGQISNLNDSIDIMMNKIGKSYDGVLKGTVSILRSMVENWEMIAAVAVPVLETLIVKWGVYKATMKYTQLVQAGFFSNMTTNLRASILYLTQGTKALNQYAAANQIAATSVKAGVWGIVIGAAVAAISSFTMTIVEHEKAIDDITKKYDELVNKIANVSVAFKNAANSNDIKKQRTELEKLVEIANTDYHMKIKVDLEGLKDEELKGKFDEIEQTILELNAFSSSFSKRFQEATEWVGTDDIREDFNQLRTAYSDLSNEIINKKQLVLAALMPIKDTLNETQQAALNQLNTSKKEGETQLEYVDRLKNAYTTLRAEYDKIQQNLYGLSRLHGDVGDKYEKQRKSLIAFLKTAKLDGDTWNSLFANFDNKTEEAKEEFKDFIQTIKDDIVGLSNEQAELKLKVAIDKLAADEEWNDFLKTTVKRWTEEYYAELGVKVNLIDKENQTKKELLAWQESYNKLFGDNIVTPNVDERLTGFKEITDSATKQKDVVERLQAEWGSYNDIIKKIEAIGVEKATGKGGAYEGVDYKQMLKDRADVEKQLDYFGEEYEKNKKKDNEALQRLKEQIRLVRELAKDYQKLWDEQGRDVADASIWSKERIAAFRKAGLDYEKFEVGGEGDEVKNLQKLTDISGELYKAIADARTELGGFKQQLKDAEFARYLDELFGNYEVSLELEKLNIPPDLAKRLFGVESIDLNSIRKEILNKAGLGDMQGMTNEAIFSSERYLKLNKEQRKIVEDGLKKENELQQKALEERLKRYSQFLVKGQSERVRIKIEELRELAKLEEDYQNKLIDEEDYKLAKRGIQEENQGKLDSLAWKEFQNTDLYIQMFEDLDYVSSSTLNNMKEKLVEMRDSLKELDPSDLKAINDQIEKIDEQSTKNNPIKALTSNLKEYIDYLKERKELEKKLLTQQGVEDKVRSQVEKAELDVSKKQAEYEKVSKDPKASTKQVADSWTLLQNAKLHLEVVLDRLVAEKKITKEFADQIRNGQNAEKTTREALQDIGSQITEAANALPQVAENLESVFGAMDAGTRDTIESIAEIGAGVGSAIQGFASGNYVQGVLGVTQAISGIFKVGDKKKEREIQSQIELVDKLGKQYEKLEKQIDKAYSLDTLQESYQAGEENLKQQIAAYDSMIAAEEGKKNTDDNRIKEWKEAQEKLQEQIEELRAQAFNEATGGILDDVKSAAREWTDAWFEAFAETGNGLDGLKDHFKENMLEMVKQQASMLITGVYLDDWKKKLEDYVNADDMRLETDEAKEWADYVTKSFPELNAALEAFATSMEQAGVSIKGTGELSGLQRGIQGITEDQADVLASYLNSIRFYVSDNNSILTNLASSINTGGAFNPIVDQLKSIADQTSAIKGLLESIKYNDGKGEGIRVYTL